MTYFFKKFLLLWLLLFTNLMYADGTDIGISIANGTAVNENDGTASFTVSLSEEADWCDEVSINYNTINGSAKASLDYSDKNGTLTFYGACDAPSRVASNISQTVSVTVLDDTIYELREYFYLNISNNTTGYKVTRSRAYVYIHDDDDGLQVRISSSDVQEGNVGDNNQMEFKIFLNKDYPLATDLTINYTTKNGSNPSATVSSDYTETSGSVIFSLNDREEIVYVPIIGDNNIEPNENLKMMITGSYVFSSESTSQSKILNDDGSYPALTFDVNSFPSREIIEGDSGQKNLNFTLQLDQPALAGSSFDYETEDYSAETSDNDYIQIAPTAHVFVGGEKNITISVKVKGDKTLEPNEEFYLKIFNASDDIKLSSSVIKSKGIILNDDGTLPSPITNIGEFRFDDCGNEEWKVDHSSTQNHIASGSPIIINDADDGKSYMCTSLNGYTGTLSIPHHTQYEMDEGTFSMLLYDHHNIWAGNSWMFQKGALKVEVVRVAGEANKGSIKVYLDGNIIDTQEVFFTNSDGTDLDTQWIHVTVSFGQKGMKLYINGIEKGTNAYTGGITAIQDNFTLATLSGYFDEFYLFKGQMSDVQIDNMYQNTINDNNIDGSSRDCGCYIPSDPFTCDSSMYISSSTNRETAEKGKMWLHKINTTENPFEFDVMEDTGATELYNATAFNPDDKYIYGLYHRELIRLSRGAEVTNLGTISALPNRFNSKQLYAGAIHGGYYYVSGRNSLSDQLFKIKLSDLSVTTITLTEGVALQDFSFYKNVNDAIADGVFLYGVEKDGKLSKIDLRDGSVTRIGSEHNGYQFDSSFSDKNGRFFANDSTGKGFFEFDLLTGSKSLISNSQSATFNDGANCINAALVFTDYGDAPSSYGTPRHDINNGIFMGNEVDHDVNAFYSIEADGDDKNGIDDEDGITLLDGSDINGTYFKANNLQEVKISVSKKGYLNAWIDYNINGVFDATDKIFTAKELSAGEHTISFNIPMDVVLNTTTYIRFRFSSTPTLDATQSATDGEVEDYAVMFGSAFQPLRGKFNIERINSGLIKSINSAERNEWYTQIVGRDFDYSIVFYDELMTEEKNISNVTLKLELMDMSETPPLPLHQYSFHIPDTMETTRINITKPLNDLTSLPATKDARFKVTYGVDASGNIIQADCLSNSVLCSDYRSDPAQDNFSIRPESFHISILDGTKELINSQNTPAKVSLAAGYKDYNLTATATKYLSPLSAEGYNKTFVKKYDFNTTGICASNEALTHTIIFKDGNHTANLSHDNVGKFIIDLYDNNWTNVDQNISHLGCLKDSTSRIADASGKVGCDLSLYLNDIEVVFQPHHFDVNLNMRNLPSSTHNDFIYMMELNATNNNVAIQFEGNITAQGEDNTTTSNFTAGCVATDILLDLNATTVSVNQPIETIEGTTINFSRVIKFNNETNPNNFDVNRNISKIGNIITIDANRFLNDNNGTMSLDMRYNLNKHLSEPINPVEVTFNSIDVNASTAKSSAHGILNYIPSGREIFTNNVKNFYFARVVSTLNNYPRVNMNISPLILTPLNVDIFCASSILNYCSDRNVTNNTNLAGTTREQNGWYLSTNHNGDVDGNVTDLIDNPNILTLSPNPTPIGANDISLNSGHHGRLNAVFNNCTQPSSTVTIITDPVLAFNPSEYTLNCTDANASQWTGIGQTGNILEITPKVNKSGKMDW